MSFGLGRAPMETAASHVDASTPWMAASEGHLALVQSSLQSLGMNVTVADENGYTLLHGAASYGQMEIMEWLISQTPEQNKSAFVNAQDAEGDTALHYAGTVAAARWLVEVAHIQVSLRNQAGKTALESKQDDLKEAMEDEDYESDDEDNVQLKAVMDYLSGLETRAAQ